MTSDIIYINAIKTRSVIGILPHERAVKQTLIISCELETDIAPASTRDDIGKALNYAEVTDFIIQFSENGHYKLLEAFAENLAAELLAKFSPLAVKLDIQKPGALATTREVGVRIYRQQQTN